MGILVMYPGPSRVKKAISFETLENVTFMKILVATEKPFAKAAVDGIREIVEGAGYELALLEKYADKAELLAAVADADGLIVRSDKVTREVIDAARNLKIVVRAGAGYDNVDLAACTERGIVVMNTPGQNSNAVAELVVSMMIFISRNQFTPGTGAEVSGKRLGIHAYGNVGRIVARYGRALGMSVKAFDPFVDPRQLEADGVCCRVSQLAVNGRDLMAAGIPAGSALRRVLEALLDGVIRAEYPNEKPALLAAAQKIIAS